MGDNKHYVFSARTTEEGLGILNGIRETKKIGWDELIIEAVAAHYEVDKTKLYIPKDTSRAEEATRKKAEKEAEKERKAKEREDAKKKKEAEKKAAEKKAAKEAADKAAKEVADKTEPTPETAPAETTEEQS